MKSGALQGALVIDNVLDHSFESLHVVYDGINGQLPNLDFINTAVSVASGQMGIRVVLQRMWEHNDSYLERLQVMLRGILSQGLGHSSGSHSSFFPYHVDAITLQAVGTGLHDEMAMGRVVEGVFRSLNNLLEHFHQSFFFYLLMQTDRFVSIGTYLPSAMLVAINFTIMAIALWVRSGRHSGPKMATTNAADEKIQPQETEAIKEGSAVAIVPKASVEIAERSLFVPLVLVVAFHFLGLVHLYIFNNFLHSVSLAREIALQVLNTEQGSSWIVLFVLTSINIWLPFGLARGCRERSLLTVQHQFLLQCFSLVLLGMFLATLATLNFSLALFIGLLAMPLSFVGPPLFTDGNDVSISQGQRITRTAILQLLSPTIILYAACWFQGLGIGQFLAEAAFGWRVNNLRTQVVVWCVWWPAWLTGSVLVSPF